MFSIQYQAESAWTLAIKWEDNASSSSGIGWHALDFVEDRDRCLALVNVEMNFWVP